jgi:hypothetical protein
MSTIEDDVYANLTHGYAKNNIPWCDAMDLAKYKLNRMDNVEFLELLGSLIDEKLKELK